MQLAEASTHGERFFCTGGGHACTDDVFKAVEYKRRQQQIATLEKDKRARKTYEEIEQSALDILEMGLTVDEMKVPELRPVLAFYGVEPKKQAKNKSRLVEKYKWV